MIYTNVSRFNLIHIYICSHQNYYLLYAQFTVKTKHFLPPEIYSRYIHAIGHACVSALCVIHAFPTASLQSERAIVMRFSEFIENPADM